MIKPKARWRLSQLVCMVFLIAQMLTLCTLAAFMWTLRLVEPERVIPAMLQTARKEMPSNPTTMTTVKQHDIKTNDSEDDGNDDDGTAFCLMVKDDNEILSEWVAYHYHVFKMRKLIVGEDPSSKTSAWDVLKRFTKEGSKGRFNLDVTVWKNDTYTPDWFRNEPRNYTRIALKEAIPGSQNNFVAVGADEINKMSECTVEKKLSVHQHNTNLARQGWLVYKCLKKIKRESKYSNITWTAIIDTDEFMVPNPWVSAHIYENAPVVNSTFVNTTGLASIFPKRPKSNSLLSFFHRYLDQNQRQLDTKGIPDALNSRGCVMMPRIAFGGKEDSIQQTFDATTSVESQNNNVNVRSRTTTIWNHKRFETLRWKYHQDLTTHKRFPASMGMKGILDTDRHDLTKNEGFGPEHIPSIFPNIHRPSSCCQTNVGHPSQWNIGHINKHEQPIAIYHYMGSNEPFLS